MADEAQTGREIWTTTAVAERLGYSEMQIRRMCEAGRFPGAYRNGGVGGHWRVPKESIEAFFEANRAKVRRRV